MVVVYAVKGAKVKKLILPSGAALEDALKILDIDKDKVKITIEEIIW